MKETMWRDTGGQGIGSVCGQTDFQETSLNSYMAIFVKLGTHVEYLKKLDKCFFSFRFNSCLGDEITHQHGGLKTITHRIRCLQ